VHAVAIDERGMVFDPSTNAPMTGTCTLAEYLEFNRKSADWTDAASSPCILARRNVGSSFVSSSWSPPPIDSRSETALLSAVAVFR
jgi:hypothetical protein